MVIKNENTYLFTSINVFQKFLAIDFPILIIT